MERDSSVATVSSQLGLVLRREYGDEEYFVVEMTSFSGFDGDRSECLTWNQKIIALSNLECNVSSY